MNTRWPERVLWCALLGWLALTSATSIYALQRLMWRQEAAVAALRAQLKAQPRVERILPTSKNYDALYRHWRTCQMTMARIQTVATQERYQ